MRNGGQIGNSGHERVNQHFDDWNGLERCPLDTHSCIILEENSMLK